MFTNKNKIFLVCALLISTLPGLLLWHDTSLYRFPVLINAEKTVVFLVVVLSLPLFAWALSLIAAIINKPFLFKTSVWLYCGLLLLSFFGVLTLELYIPFLYSYTTDVQNIGKYDSIIEEQLNFHTEYIFPDKIPDDAHDAQYSYSYYNEASPDYWIELSYSTNQEACQNVRERALASNYDCLDGDKVFRLSPKLSSSVSEIVIDDDTGKITYYLVYYPNESNLPDSLSEYRTQGVSEGRFETIEKEGVKEQVSDRPLDTPLDTPQSV